MQGCQTAVVHVLKALALFLIVKIFDGAGMLQLYDRRIGPWIMDLVKNEDFWDCQPPFIDFIEGISFQPHDAIVDFHTSLPQLLKDDARRRRPFTYTTISA